MPKACIVFMMLAMHQLDSDHLPGLYIPCKIDLGHAPPGQAMEDEIMVDCYCFQFQHDLALPGWLSKVYTLLSWNLCQENTASVPIWRDYAGRVRSRNLCQLPPIILPISSSL